MCNRSSGRVKSNRQPINNRPSAWATTSLTSQRVVIPAMIMRGKGGVHGVFVDFHGYLNFLEKMKLARRQMEFPNGQGANFYLTSYLKSELVICDYSEVGLAWRTHENFS